MFWGPYANGIYGIMDDTALVDIDFRKDVIGSYQYQYIRPSEFDL